MNLNLSSIVKDVASISSAAKIAAGAVGHKLVADYMKAKAEAKVVAAKVEAEAKVVEADVKAEVKKL
jgi:hypothetical protein